MRVFQNYFQEKQLFRTYSYSEYMILCELTICYMYSFESTCSNIINRELLKIYINMNAYLDLKTRVYNKYLSLMYIKKYNISYNLILSGQISRYSPYLFQTLIEN